MRKKLKRFTENENRDNILQTGKPIFETIKGRWSEDYFDNNNPITIELGCGDGEYTVGLASQNPDRNFIGIDIKGDRLHQGSTQAIELGLKNVAFLRTQILLLENFFEEGEVDEIWLTFPDPRPKDRDEKRRLTHPRFLNLYRKLSRKGCWFKFKTDSTSLFDYTLDVMGNQFDAQSLEFTHDLYKSNLIEEHFGIQTKYEKIWSAKGEKIKYLKCQL